MIGKSKYGGILINISAEQAREALRAIDKIIHNPPQAMTDTEQIPLQKIAHALAKQHASRNK